MCVLCMCAAHVWTLLLCCCCPCACVGAVWTPGDNPRLKLYKYRMSHWGYDHHHHHHHHDCCMYPLCGTESTVVALGSAVALVGTRGGIVALEWFEWTGGTIHPIETRLLGHHRHFYQHLSSTREWIAGWLSLKRSLGRGKVCEVQREWGDREGEGRLLSGWHGRSSGKILFCVRARHVFCR